MSLTIPRRPETGKQALQSGSSVGCCEIPGTFNRFPFHAAGLHSLYPVPPRLRPLADFCKLSFLSLHYILLIFANPRLMRRF